MNLSIFLVFTSFIAGAFTILAPCVLPLLPVIIGGAAGAKNRWYPLILVSSLSLSIVIFTLLLKAPSTIISIPQGVLKGISGGIVLVFGLFWVFPGAWEAISTKLNFLGWSQKGLQGARKMESNKSAILMGAALGPVFASCSPTYFFILATVLPVSFINALIYLIFYGVGLGLMLGLIAFFGQSLTHKLGWVADSKGWLKRSIGILLVIVGLAVITGVDKKVEAWVLNFNFGITEFEQNLIDSLEVEQNEMEAIKEAQAVPNLENGLKNPFLAPELAGLENWLNTEPISSMEELKGKVVLVDFWTYSCINCIRTLPYLQDWHEKYADDGLVVLGVHTPEFQFERQPENVKKASLDFGLTYPIAQDNDRTLWGLYNNRYWPAKYLIDQNGVVRYTHFGEGEYEETEQNIIALLETDVEISDVKGQPVDFEKIKTPETYIGLRRRANFVEDNTLELSNSEWTLMGEWDANDERAITLTEGAGIKMKFTAAKANLVIGGTGTATVLVDGERLNSKDVKDGVLQIEGERLYELANFGMNYDLHEIEVIFDQPDLEIFAWTFG